MDRQQDQWAQWLLNRRFGADAASVDERAQFMERLLPVRDQILDRAALEPGETLLDVGSSGLRSVRLSAYEVAKRRCNRLRECFVVGSSNAGRVPDGVAKRPLTRRGLIRAPATSVFKSGENFCRNFCPCQLA
jgi:hypothetical protein